MAIVSGAPLTQPNAINQVLEHGLQANPDALALGSAKTRMSWRQLDDVSTLLALQYLNLG